MTQKGSDNEAKRQRAKLYDELTKDYVQMELDLSGMMEDPEPTIYGYARVSTKKQAKDGNSLEVQEAALKAAGAQKIYSDTYTGTVTDRPELESLMGILKYGDTLVVTKLDRIARSTMQGLQLVQELVKKGVTVNVLNMGALSDKPVPDRGGARSARRGTG